MEWDPVNLGAIVTGEQISLMTIKACEGGQDYLRIGQDGAWDDFNSMADISGTEIKSFICETDINEFSINYHLNGGKNASDNPTTYIADNNIVFGKYRRFRQYFNLKNPTKEHYIFKGWYTAENWRGKI